MKIAILGAGFTGLSAAYRLSKQGHQVVVFEKDSFAGGLASGFKNRAWEWPLERFYHHFFTSDSHLISLTKEIGLEKKLLFKNPLTATYYEGAISPVDSPLALLKFPHLSFTEKTRMGLALASLKMRSNYSSLEQITAEAWLKRSMGEKPFKVLWEPLLQAKFGNYADKVTAAWFWARIKKRSMSLGYIEGGFQTLIDRLVEKISKNSGKIFFNKEVQKIERDSSRFLILGSQFNIVISTLSTPVFLKIAPRLPSNFESRLAKIPHFWAQVLFLELKETFLKSVYWLNINDTSFPFVVAVEHTNFIDKSHYGNRRLLYIGNYLPDNHPYLKKTAAELLKIFIPYLQKINPHFNFELLNLNFKLFTAPHAQTIVTVGYRPPEITTPIPGLYLANLDSVYPWDRETNYAIELGSKVANSINANHT